MCLFLHRCALISPSLHRHASLTPQSEPPKQKFRMCSSALMISPNLEQGHHHHYLVYLTSKSMCLDFLTIPTKVNFAELHCIGLIGTCANLPLDCG